ENVFWISFDVRDMNHLAFEQGSPTNRASIGGDGNIFYVIHKFAREAVSFGAVKPPVDLPCGRGHVSIAEFRSGFDERLEHGCEIERRTTNGLEPVGRGGLLLKRLPQLVKQPRVLDG